MAELMFVGVTHYPPLNLRDEEMAGLLHFALQDPSIPAEQKDEAFRDVSLDALEAAGQQELLNWCALAGAMHETAAVIDRLTFVESFIFNSNKCFLIGQPGGQQ